MFSCTPTKCLPEAGLLYWLAPSAGSMTLVSVTSSWVPLLSLTASADPSCPALPLAGAAAAAAPWVPAGCGGDGEHAASVRTAAVAAAPSEAGAIRRRANRPCIIGRLLRVEVSRPAAR